MRWRNDTAARHLWQWFPDAASLDRFDTLDSVRASYTRVRPTHKAFFILLDGRPVGEICWELDAPQGKRKIPGTAWLSVVIGEPTARGRGIGWDAMRTLEAFARGDGATRLEIGVFAFNARAIALYRKLGYVEFDRVPDFSWWNGRTWDDIRLEKPVEGLADARAGSTPD